MIPVMPLLVFAFFSLLPVLPLPGLAFLSLFGGSYAPTAQPARQQNADTNLRARYIITTTDDMVVDAYLNGRQIPDSRRTLLLERFGATVERINVEVHKGDWLVFNVVNNRMRWGGAYYFGVAGCLDKNEFGFVSNLDSGNWSVCDSLRDVDTFIDSKTYLQHHAPQPVTNPWGEGDACMRGYAGDAWKGTPLWGTSRNTWVKVIVD